MKNPADAARQQRAFIVVRYDAADNDADVFKIAFLQRIKQVGNKQMVGCQGADADYIGIFVLREPYDFGDRLSGWGINNFHAAVAQLGRNDATSAIMTIQTNLGNDNFRAIVFGQHG